MRTRCFSFCRLSRSYITFYKMKWKWLLQSYYDDPWVTRSVCSAAATGASVVACRWWRRDDRHRWPERDAAFDTQECGLCRPCTVTAAANTDEAEMTALDCFESRTLSFGSSWVLRPEMDVRSAETGDDGRTSLQLDLGDTGSYVAPFGLYLFIVGQPQTVEVVIIGGNSFIPGGSSCTGDWSWPEVGCSEPFNHRTLWIYLGTFISKTRPPKNNLEQL